MRHYPKVTVTTIEKNILFVGIFLLLALALLIPVSFKNISVGAGYSWRASGTLVKTSSGSAIYVVENGFKKLVPTMSVFTALGYSTDNIVTVTSDELSAMNTGTQVSTAFSNTYRVIRQQSTTALYRLVNRVKRYIATMNIFTALGYTSSDIEDVTALEFSHYPTDSVHEEILSPTSGQNFTRGSLIKGSTAAAVYVVDEFGLLRHIVSSDAFTAAGFSWDNVLTVTQAAVTDMTKGANYPQ